MSKRALSLFILDEGGRPVRVSREVWGPWFEMSRNRRVATTITAKHRISTVFIGVGHVLFETMSFNGENDQVIMCERRSNWDDAVAAHHFMVARMQKQELAES